MDKLLYSMQFDALEKDMRTDDISAREIVRVAKR
jgi:hypothetical protein